MHTRHSTSAFMERGVMDDAALEAPEAQRSGDEDDGLHQGMPRISRASKSPAKGNPAKHRVRHRKQRQGQTIFKGHPSWKMVINIKLGISYTVGRQEDAVSARVYTQ